MRSILRRVYRALPLSVRNRIGVLRKRWGGLREQSTGPLAEAFVLLGQGRTEEALCLARAQEHRNERGLEALCWEALSRGSDSALVYNALSAELRRRGEHQMVDQLASGVRSAGLGRVGRGDLTGAVQFFEEVEETFPEVASAYLELYRLIGGMLDDLSLESASEPPARREAIVSLTVWGDRYADLLLRYFLPSMLAPGNIPEVARRREVCFEIYTTPDLASKIERAPIVSALREHAAFRIVTFPTSLIESAEYRREPNTRYYIYGGFHHVSMARAGVRGADLFCIAPDGVHADGSFGSYIGMIDEGAEAVVFTSVRGQAEHLLPELDAYRHDSGALCIPPRKLVGLAVQNVHHDFARYVLAPEVSHAPQNMSIYLIPTRTGFVVRAFHLHPIALSADCLRRSAEWDFSTVDGNMMARIFKDPDDWKKIRIVETSDQGAMMDLTYQMEEFPFPERRFSPEELTQAARHFEPLHHWYFSHRILYEADQEFEAVGCYERSDAGDLERRRLSLPTDGLALADDMAMRVAAARESIS